MTAPVVQRTTVPLKLSNKQLSETRCPDLTCHHPAGEHKSVGNFHYCVTCNTERKRGHRTSTCVCRKSFDDINAGSIQGRYGSSTS
jgi:hypothetical protein